ncbi:MAG: hypothetical protein V2I97_10640, partial [Desulfococcaceae bacterium]|nr:hypothetical protein [Desulfococcaceae bacterium]
MPKKRKWISALFLCAITVALLSVSAVWADTNVSGSISADTRWNLSGSPYIVTGDVTVEAGMTLTIDPGVQVKFDSGFSLIVYGILNAVG